MRLSCLFLCVMFTTSLLLGDIFNPRIKANRPEIPKLSIKEKTRYEKLARLYLPQLWSNDYSNVEMKIYHYDVMGRNHQNFVRAMINAKKGKCKLTFDKKKADAVVSASNTQYDKCSNDNYEIPIHVTKDEARNRATEISEMFGISNLWDKSKFTVQYQEFDYGIWNFCLTAIINGYPSLYGVSVSIADTQETNIYRWSTTMHDIPLDLGTNVVLSAIAGRSKATEYLEKYHSNEKALEDYHDGACTNNPVLTWVNYFKNNTGSKYDRHFPILIYVDAETGEMLGGM
jgi:hypothetical protein